MFSPDWPWTQRSCLCSCLLSSTPDSCGCLIVFIYKEARQTFNKKIILVVILIGNITFSEKVQESLSSLKSCVLLLRISFMPHPQHLALTLRPACGRQVLCCSSAHLALHHLTTTGELRTFKLDVKSDFSQVICSLIVAIVCTSFLPGFPACWVSSH